MPNGDYRRLHVIERLAFTSRYQSTPSVMFGFSVHAVITYLSNPAVTLSSSHTASVYQLMQCIERLVPPRNSPTGVNQAGMPASLLNKEGADEMLPKGTVPNVSACASHKGSLELECKMDMNG